MISSVPSTGSVHSSFFRHFERRRKGRAAARTLPVDIVKACVADGVTRGETSVVLQERLDDGPRDEVGGDAEAQHVPLILVLSVRVVVREGEVELGRLVPPDNEFGMASG